MSSARIRSCQTAPRSALVVSLLLLTLGLGPGTRSDAQVRPVYSAGAAGVLQRIMKLQTTASVLEVGAHPDDEDSAFMARAARGDHARVAYLSLTRGEGGQNAIGPELFDALGVIRTEELLQARTLDGGEQFFGREYDYGFSKTMEEASRLWGDREVLRDMVRIIRQFRPLVIYSIFSGTPADGHGHHQLSGRLTPEAFHAAADPAQFPEQIAEGLRPWQAKKLYRNTGSSASGFGPGTTARVEVGQVDPLLGRSYAEIAAEGRSQHKTQGMGTPEARGPRESGLGLIEATLQTQDGETSVFDGIDTSITGLAALAGLPAGALQNELAALDEAVRKALADFSPLQPGRAVPPLADALAAIRAARASARTLPGASENSREEADFLLAAKERDAAAALQGAAGITIDAVSDVETAAPGESFGCAVRVFLAGPTAAAITTATVRAPEGWRVAPAAAGKPGPGFIPEIADRVETFALTVPPDALPTQPYWLRAVREGELNSWPSDAPRGSAFEGPLAAALVGLEIGGVPVTLTQPVQYRLVDPVRGELRRNVEIVPAITVSLDPPLEIVPLEMRGKPRPVSVVLQSNSQAAVTGILKLDLPGGWSVSPAESPFNLPRKGAHVILVCNVTTSRDAAPGRYPLKAVAVSDDRLFNLSMRTLSYPHIQTHRIYTQARTQVCVMDLKVAPVKVGYVMGTGDQVPEALRRMGLDVTLLGEEALSAGDLDRFDTIVAGINASAARPDFVAASARMNEYVRNGGTLIVQYQHDDYIQRNLPPFPAQMASRVTDETAEVKILVPDHPVFMKPNRITARDFSDWVQERNLYAFTTFDPRYTALLESHDPGEPPQRGGEVYARLGKGQYVYTAYAWFRQLPAGVPGAYRLFANLVSLGAKK